MSPVVVTTVFLWVLLISMEASAWNPGEMCKSNQYKTQCRSNLGAGWFQMGYRCVKAFKEKKNFHNAEKACNQYKNGYNTGHLVSIHDEGDRNQVLCAMWSIDTGKAHYWIGLKRTNLFSFHWLDRSMVKYRSWANGQPDNFLFRENCVEMNYWSWGLWNDADCGQHKPYLCAV